MTANDHKLNHVVTSVATAIPDMVSMLEHTHTSCTWYAVIKLKDAFLPISVDKDHQSVCFRLVRPAIHLYHPTQEYVSSSALCYNLVYRDFDHCIFLQDIILVHYVYDIMFTGPCEQEVETILDTLARTLHAKGHEINLKKNLEISYLCGICRCPVL